MSISNQRQTGKVVKGIGTGLTAAGGVIAATGIGAPIGAIVGGVGMLASGAGNMIGSEAEQRQAALEGRAYTDQQGANMQGVASGVGSIMKGITGMKGNNPNQGVGATGQNAMAQGMQTAILQNGGMMQNQNNITQYNGNSHAQGGIPVGPGNEVEGGETRGIGYTKDYIFSDKLKVAKEDMTFAEKSKKIEGKYKGLDNDRYAVESKNKELGNLMQEQETKKQKLFAMKLNSLAKNHPEQFQQMMQAQQPQEQQQVPPEQMQEQVPRELAYGGPVIPPYKPGSMNLTTPEFSMPGINPLGINQVGNQPQVLQNPVNSNLGNQTTVIPGEITTTPSGNLYGNLDPQFYETNESINYNKDGESWNEPYNRGKSFTQDSTYKYLVNDLGISDEMAKQFSGNPQIMQGYFDYIEGDTDFYNQQKTKFPNLQNEQAHGDRLRYGQHHQWKLDPDKITTYMERMKTREPSIIPPIKGGPIPDLPNDPFTGNPGDVPQDNIPVEGNLEGGNNKDLSPLWSAVPNVVQGIGNAFLGAKLKYPRAKTHIMDPDYVDPTRPAQEIREQYSNVKDKARQVSSGGGNYLSNLVGATAGESKGLASLYSQYAQANAGIHNQAAQFNAQALNQGSQFNAQLGMQEKQDKVGLYQNALEGIATGGNNALNSYYQEKRANDMLAMAGGENFSYYNSPNGPTKLFTGYGYSYYTDPKTGKKVYTQGGDKEYNSAQTKAYDLQMKQYQAQLDSLEASKKNDAETRQEIKDLKNQIESLNKTK